MPACIEARHITKRFALSELQESAAAGESQIRDGFFYALDDVSFSINRGECVVFGGANGSGKSLLMLIIASLAAPSEGEIVRSEDVGLIFQNPESQILGETPREDAAIGPRNLKKSKAEANLCAEKALRQVHLLDKADFPARFLSGGEKRRLCVAGVLAMDCAAVIFDEPYANLDYDGVRDVNRLILELKKEGKTLLILTHEIEKCLAAAGRFIILSKGKIVFDGTPETGLKAPLEEWGIRHPLYGNKSAGDLLWL